MTSYSCPGCAGEWGLEQPLSPQEPGHPEHPCSFLIIALYHGRTTKTNATKKITASKIPSFMILILLHKA